MWKEFMIHPLLLVTVLDSGKEFYLLILSPLYFLPLYTYLCFQILGDLTKLGYTLMLSKVFRAMFQISFLAYLFRKILELMDFYI